MTKPETRSIRLCDPETIKKRDHRLSGRKRTEAADTRTEAQRDKDRISYSTAWRRLGGVTQVVTPFEDIPLLHNRLTHSEKVAQVSRSVAEVLLNKKDNHDAILKLGGLDVDVAEAAGMAHDLGHPPFGHIGEHVLDEIARDSDLLPGLHDGFEGNAQTFRTAIIGKVRNLQYEGLDLTSATLAAIAKYPWKRATKLNDTQHDSSLKQDSDYRRTWKKFNAYESEYPALQTAREFLPKNFGVATQTLEASVMDLADDITYAVHDLEDFYISGILDIRAILDELDAFVKTDVPSSQDNTLENLAARLKIDYIEYFNDSLFEDAVSKIAEELRRGFSTKYEGQLEQEGKARQRGSALIGRYVNSVKLSTEQAWTNGPYVAIPPKEWHEIQVLKEITKSYVVRRPDIALLQRGQQLILERLIEMLLDWMAKDFDRLPPQLKREIQISRGLEAGTLQSGYVADRYAPRGPDGRSLLDYVCRLTDGQCLSLYYKLSGAQMPRLGWGGFV